jgi:putative membrane protein
MRRIGPLATALCGGLWTSFASAHLVAGGDTPVAGGQWSDCLVETTLIVSVLAYAGGLARALVRAPGRWPIAKWRVACFFGAIAVLALALLSPIDELADAFFAVHMGQHLLLILVAAPLLAVSDAHLIFLRVFPLSSRRALGLAISRIPGMKQASYMPAAAWLACGAFVVALGFWHIPAAYDWALSHPWGHALEHLTLIIAAIAFWRMIVTSGRSRLSPGMAVMVVSLVGLQGAFMGAIISFAQHPLYAAYAGNSLNDQALAGVMMCIPASFIYLASSIWALARMLRNKPSRGRSSRDRSLRTPFLS